VALVSRTFADRYLPDGGAIGRRIQFGNMDGDARLMEIVGVVGDVRERGLDRDARPVLYANALQRPRSWTETFVVRADSGSAAVTAAMRTALRDLAPDTAATFRTLEQVYASSVDDRRFSLVLFAAFAAVALALALTGIYGVMSYSVAQRTREIGIQMALGAQRRDVLALVLGRGLRLALVGVLIGLAGALALTRVLAGLLYGVSATDPLTLGGIAALLVAAALVACLAPARRATKVDPLVALKYE
jgi:predicted lysophospholipase L1 biosynthesis ABC-type transport system permease subunit